MLKSISTQAYETVITAGVYNDSFTHEDMHKNKNIPVLEIEYVSREECISLYNSQNVYNHAIRVKTK
jgi:hypothetical protein